MEDKNESFKIVASATIAPGDVFAYLGMLFYCYSISDGMLHCAILFPEDIGTNNRQQDVYADWNTAVVRYNKIKIDLGV